MIYVKIKQNYNQRNIQARMAQLIDNCALNPPIWERDDKAPDIFSFPYNYELIVPIKVAELIPGDWILIRSYTSEELAPLHEDKIIFNEKTGCAVPNSALWSVEQVRVETDLCTDMLQDFLREGWHILAICPQPQRRPDYVLGRGAKLHPQKLEARQPASVLDTSDMSEIPF